MYQRPQLQILKKRLNEPRRFMQVILGPRQVGKTTLVKQFTQDEKHPWIFASADDVPATGGAWIEQQWENARLLLRTRKSAYAILIIDEIQKIHNWSETVKAQWDKDTFDDIPLKVVLLGSARLTIQKGLTESLAGRYEVITMTHWGYSEMHQAFDLSPEDFVWFGGYPGSAALINEEERWKDYIMNSLIETTISKDILMLSRIDKPALLKQLFELGCAYSGQILSYSKIVGQLQDAGNTSTLSHYLQLLDSAGLLSALEKFSRGLVRQKASIPKWQVQNNALFSVMSGRNYEKSRTDLAIWGRHVESAIGVHLLNSCKQSGFQLYYWRDRNDEIDFVLTHGKKVIGLEVKSGTQHKLSGMEAFKDNMKPDKIYLIGKGGLPWQEFLKMKIEDLF